jgi:hypothetical protein
MPAMGYLEGVFCSGISGSRAEHPLGKQVQLSGSGRSLGAVADAQHGAEIADVLLAGPAQAGPAWRE